MDLLPAVSCFRDLFVSASDITGFVLNMTRFVLTMTGFVLNMTGLVLNMIGSEKILIFHHKGDPFDLGGRGSKSYPEWKKRVENKKRIIRILFPEC